MGRKKEQKLNKKKESPEDKRKRLARELRLFGHKEAAKLLEADGRAGEFTVVYGTWSPNAKGKPKLQVFGPGEESAQWARERAEWYRGLTEADKSIHRDPDAVGVWSLASEWLPMVGYSKPVEDNEKED